MVACGVFKVHLGSGRGSEEKVAVTGSRQKFQEKALGGKRKHMKLSIPVVFCKYDSGSISPRVSGHVRS